jgi:hypothetical protein
MDRKVEYIKALECVPRGFDKKDIEGYANITRAFELFRSKLEGSADSAHRFLKKELRLITHTQFEDQLVNCITWLNRVINEQKYCVVTERLLEQTVDGTKCNNDSIPQDCKKNSYKSSEWVFNTVRGKLVNQPEHIIDIWDVKYLKSVIANSGIKLFVHFDDAIYSGTQKRDMFKTFFEYVAWEEEYDDESKDITVLLCVPFISNDGYRNILDNVSGQLVFGPHQNIKSISDFEKEYPDVNIGKALDSAKTLTAFHHKLPDYLSFPKPIASLLKDFWMTPPYKCVYDT